MAARNILTPYNFNKNEIQNAVAQNLASAPGTPVPGQFYYDTGTGKFTWRNATVWVDPLARAAHTGTQLAATISDFDTQVRTSTLNQMAPPTVDLSINSKKLTNVLDGTAAQDAATFGQLTTALSAAANVSTLKGAVRAVSSVNINIASPGTTIDGLTAANGETFFLAGQTTGTQNGPYVFTGSASAMTRATNWDAAGEAVVGSYWIVQEGTQADKFALLTNDTFTLGSSTAALTFTGAGTAYTGGTGIDVTGTVISILTTVVTRKYAANVGDNSLTTIPVAHGLATLDVQVQVFENSTGATVECDMVRTSTSNVNLVFTVAPTTDQYRVLVQG